MLDGIWKSACVREGGGVGTWIDLTLQVHTAGLPVPTSGLVSREAAFGNGSQQKLWSHTDLGLGPNFAIYYFCDLG